MHDSDDFRSPASFNQKLKILSVFNRSVTAANRWPLSLQITMDALFGTFPVFIIGRPFLNSTRVRSGHEQPATGERFALSALGPTNGRA
jgi:hypothetical protein